MIHLPHFKSGKLLEFYLISCNLLWVLVFLIYALNLQVFGRYLNCFYNEKVPYFWNKDGNLIENMKRDTMINHYNELLRLYNKIDREYKSDPTVVAKVICK